MSFPIIYEINTRIVLDELGVALGRRASLDDIPDAMMEEMVERGFTWLWLLGVWQTGEMGRQVARQDPMLRAVLERELPDLGERDILSSPFAVQAYDVHADFGGDGALRRFREGLARRGIGLVLDFVPNHVAIDHPWVFGHPEFLIHAREEDLVRAPQNYVRIPTRLGPAIVAHGRDPNFDGWRDTVQLNFRHPCLREAQIATLTDIADRCDGVRCDMAMLIEPAIIARTWGDRAQPIDGAMPDDSPFWPLAISTVRRRRADFMFVAEVYGGWEWTLQQHGFDFTYDKRLYDRLRAGVAGPVREHLQAAPAFGDRSLRFLENHDEPRAASAFGSLVHRAAAVIALFAPGMRLVHEGQIEGRRVHTSMQLARRPAEPIDHELRDFYRRLLAVAARPEVQTGQWRLWPCAPVSQGDLTHDQFIVSTWEAGDRRLLIVVNYGPAAGRGTIALNFDGLGGRRWRLVDLMADTEHELGEDELSDHLRLDLPSWGHRAMAIVPR